MLALTTTGLSVNADFNTPLTKRSKGGHTNPEVGVTAPSHEHRRGKDRQFLALLTSAALTKSLWRGKGSADYHIKITGKILIFSYCVSNVKTIGIK